MFCMTSPLFLDRVTIDTIAQKYELPVYVYSEAKLHEYSDAMLAIPHAYWLSVRYAMKANSNQNILRLLNTKGIKIDASSSYEAIRAYKCGIPAGDIELCGQELPGNLKELVDMWVEFLATSLHQLEAFGKLFPGHSLGIRVNPGEGSGAFKKISTGWRTSAFGIWHEYLPQVKQTAEKYGLKITKIHQHIGSENTPEAWVESAKMGLAICEQFPDVHTFNMGGGFKMAIMPYEKTADLQGIGNLVKTQFEDFFARTGRKLHLEVEPGKYLVINSCSVIARIVDIVDTTPEKWGYTFIRTNTGMTEMPRVTMYGVQQPIHIINSQTVSKKYAVVWHCCESGDLLTCKLYQNEEIEERELSEASIWDIIVFDGSGAYNSAMSMKNYNSFPEVGELLVCQSGEIVEIRKRQTLEDIWKNEISFI